MSPKKFRINQYLSLKLEADKTMIYVGEDPFKQCKYLLLDILIKEITSLDKLKSIDEASGKLDHSLEPSNENANTSVIPPEVEFWAHCSNLQAWVENDYNTDLLDSILSFPLLKKLTESGDPFAKRVFKEEIAKRLMRGDFNTTGYLVGEGYLKFLTTEEITNIFSSEDCCNFHEIHIPLTQ